MSAASGPAAAHVPSPSFTGASQLLASHDRQSADSDGGEKLLSLAPSSAASTHTPHNRTCRHMHAHTYNTHTRTHTQCTHTYTHTYTYTTYTPTPQAYHTNTACTHILTHVCFLSHTVAHTFSYTLSCPLPAPPHTRSPFCPFPTLLFLGFILLFSFRRAPQHTYARYPT